jgi:tetratricopeptide (TPR) repeat protein
VGKTALVVHWAHRNRHLFPDGQLYVNLRGFDPRGTVVDPSEVLRAVLEALGIPGTRVPADLDAQAGLYRTVLADRRMLVVLDNARDPDQVRPLLPGVPGCLVLVTSRNQLTGLSATEGARLLSMQLLAADEARALLAYRIGTDRVRREPDAVHEIVTRCAGLPLALAIVAARATAQPDRPLNLLATELRRRTERLDALSIGDVTADVRAIFSWSYDALTPAAARLFRLLGLHPGPEISAAAAASLAGLPQTQVRRLLTELTGAHLLTEPVTGRYACHDLLHAYATEQVTGQEDADGQRAALRRLLDHYLHTTYAADRLLYPHWDAIAPPAPEPAALPENFADGAAAAAWFAAEHPVLLAAVEHAGEAGLDLHAWHLAWALTPYLSRQGHWHGQVRSQQAALVAATRLADRDAQARTNRGLGRVYARLGRHRDARRHYTRALHLYAQLDDPTGQAHTQLGLAYLRELEGYPRDGIGHAQRAVRLYETVDDDAGRARALNGVGWLHGLVGAHEQTLRYCRQALAVQERIGDAYGQAATADSIGHAHHQLGRYQQAIVWYRRSLDLRGDSGDQWGTAETLTRLGETHRAAGDTDAARTCWRRALETYDDLEHPNADEVRVRLKETSTPGSQPPAPLAIGSVPDPDEPIVPKSASVPRQNTTLPSGRSTA